MQSGRDIGFVVHKRNRDDRFCRLSTMHECDRQTDKNRQTDYGTVTSIAIVEIAYQKYRLIIQYASIL